MTLLSVRYAYLFAKSITSVSWICKDPISCCITSKRIWLSIFASADLEQEPRIDYSECNCEKIRYWISMANLNLIPLLLPPLLPNFKMSSNNLIYNHLSRRTHCWQHPFCWLQGASPFLCWVILLFPGQHANLFPMVNQIILYTNKAKKTLIF